MPSMTSLPAKHLVVPVGILAALMIGALAAVQPLAAIGLIGASALFALAVARPTAALSLWLAVLLLLPEWTRLTAPGLGTFRLYQLLAIPVLVGVIASPNRARLRLHRTDLVFLLGLVGVWFFVWQGMLPAFSLTNAALSLGLGYLAGRLAHASGDLEIVFARIAVVIAIWGVIEAATNVHLFTSWFVSADHHWNEIQVRSGRARAEAAMGHAIAFGATCALAIPFAKLLRYPRLAAAILVAGCLSSLSRGPMIALVCAATLTAVLLIGASKRLTTLMAAGGAGVAVYLVFGLLSSGDDAQRTEMSGAMRGYQFEQTFNAANWFSPAVTLSGAGRLTANAVAVIDSTPLRFGLNFGWVVGALLLAPLIALAFTVWRRPSIPAVAIVSQVPVLIVTSLITQWQVLIFFLAALAISRLGDPPDVTPRPAVKSDRRSGTAVRR